MPLPKTLAELEAQAKLRPWPYWNDALDRPNMAYEPNYVLAQHCVNTYPDLVKAVENALAVIEARAGSRELHDWKERLSQARAALQSAKTIQ